MDGIEGATELLRAWLEQRLPVRLALQAERLAERGNTDPLPSPGLVAGEERGPVGIELWPLVEVLPVSTDALELLDVLPGGVELYRVRYTLRVVSWVRSDDPTTTATLRKRYALAVRECLLERKALGPAGRAGEFTTDPRSLRESYSDLMVDEAADTFAGVWVDVAVTVAEALDATEVLGTAQHFDVSTSISTTLTADVPWVD